MQGQPAQPIPPLAVPRMKVVYLASGAGAMYCGSCLHGNALVAALAERGEDVMLVPLYTPLRTDEPSVAIRRMALGGLNVYLQQKSALFRHAPRWVDWFLDRPGLLRLAGRFAGGTRPEGLGPLTVSMLRGEQGRQRKEVDKLIEWLRREVRPELVHLSNVLLAGLAEPIARRLGVPVLASLTGEDAFLAALPEPYRSRSRWLLAQSAGRLDRLVALCGDYADFMAGYLAVDRARIQVVRPGINLQGYAERPRQPMPSEAGQPPPRPFTIGFLSRISPEKGLHLLAQAVALLIEKHPLRPIRLRVAGYLAAGQRRYLWQIRRRMARRAAPGAFEYLGQPDREEKIRFLQSLDVLSVPALGRESKGIPALEAWAGGVPTVLPDRGAFGEMTRDSGGGLLVEPGDAAALARALERLLCRPELGEEFGRRGHAAVRDRYHAAAMAERMAAVYAEVLGGHAGDGRTRQQG